MFHFSVFFTTRSYRRFIVLGLLIQSHLLIGVHSPCASAILLSFLPFSLFFFFLPPSEGELKLGRRSEPALIVPAGFDNASSNINSDMKGGLDICKQSNKLLFSPTLLSSGMSRECKSQASVGEICSDRSQGAWRGLICRRQIAEARKETLCSDTSAFRVCSSSASGETLHNLHPDLLHRTFTDIYQIERQLLLRGTLDVVNASSNEMRVKRLYLYLVVLTARVQLITTCFYWSYFVVVIRVSV